MSETEALLPAVSRFEANLLEILRFFLRKGLVERVQRRIVEPCPRPKCLSRAAVTLVQDTLGKGCAALLARSGGWRRERYLRGGKVAEGRLWERTEPEELGLAFSRHSLDFLLWVTEENLDDQKAPWWSPSGKGLTVGDQLLLYFAYGGLRQTQLVQTAARHKVFATHTLCRLAYPEDFNEVPAGAVLDFGMWTEGQGACVLEALQVELAERWVAAERSKGQIILWRLMQGMARSQEAALEPFLKSVEAAGRLDLARFLLAALARLVTEDATAQRWLEGIRDRGPTMAERVQTGRDALVVVRQLRTMRRWAQEARGVPFFEENYAASQLWKTDWERWQGEVLHARAEAILRQVEPL